jgi:hypothetical protein
VGHRCGKLAADNVSADGDGRAVGVELLQALGGGDDPDGPILHEAWLPEVRPEIPEPPASLDVAHLATAPVRVFVLGPVEVQCGNDIDDDRRALATEIVVYL